MKVRIKFSKYGSVKFIGHLDVMRYFQKAIRRAGIDIAYSEGYSPHQVMSFAAPLSVGHTSDGEYFDIELKSFDGEIETKNRLQAVMVDGIDILSVMQLPETEGNAMASVTAAAYQVAFRSDVELPDNWDAKLLDFYGQAAIPVVKQTKRGEKEIDLKESIYELKVIEIAEDIRMSNRQYKGIYLLLNASSGGNIKPSFVLETFFNSIGYELPPFGLLVHRIDTYKNVGTESERELVPLIWEK